MPNNKNRSVEQDEAASRLKEELDQFFQHHNIIRICDRWLDLYDEENFEGDHSTNFYYEVLKQARRALADDRRDRESDNPGEGFVKLVLTTRREYCDEE